MKKHIRKILFWFIFLLFLVTTPVAVLYSQGYRFDQNRMIFVHSGSITLKPLPTSVNVFVDGKPQSTNNLDIINNSVTVGGLRPGNYQLRVASDGYGSWEKNVEVHSGLSTEFWNIVLIPDNPELKEIESQNVSRFFPSPFGKKVAYIENLENSLNLWIIDFKKNEKQLVYSKKNISAYDDQFENIEWNFKEDLFLAPVLKDSRKDYIIASASGEFEPYYLSEISALKNMDKARWSPKEKNVFYFLAKEDGEEKSNLYRINLDEKKPFLVLPEVVTYDFSQKSIYYLEESNILFKSDLEGGNATQINNNQLMDQPAGEKARLIVYDEDRQALISQEGDLFVHNNGSQDLFRKVASSVQGVQFSDDGKKLLFWGNNEISTMFLRKWEVQPYRDENEIQTIIRVSSPLENVFWYRDYEHIFFSVKNKIKLLELDPRDRRICSDVLENNLDDFPATYDAGNGYYYFLKDSNGDKKIFYFSLPENIGFFD